MRLLIGALALVLAGGAQAQTWPDKPVHIIVAFTPGSATDVIARSMSNELSARLGQPVIIENRPGAGGTIANAFVSKAPADGYTLLVDSSGHTVNPWIYGNLSYDTVKDLKGVTLLARQPNVLVVAPDRSWKIVADLVNQAKAQPGKMSFASAGVGSATHMNGEKFKVAAGIDVLHVPYKGTGGAVQDLLGGQVNMMFLPVHVALPQVEAGKLRLLAAGGTRRAAVTPNVPSLAEASGVADIDVDIWYALYAPAGTPPAIIAKLNADANALLKSPEVADVLAKQGLTATGGSAADLAKLTATDLARWARVIHDAHITAE